MPGQSDLCPESIDCLLLEWLSFWPIQLWQDEDKFIWYKKICVAAQEGLQKGVWSRDAIIDTSNTNILAVV